jgi:hypothetical protein
MHKYWQLKERACWMLQALDTEVIARLEERLQSAAAANQQHRQAAAAEVGELRRQLQAERRRHRAEVERQRAELDAAYTDWRRAEREVATMHEEQAQVGAVRHTFLLATSVRQGISYLAAVSWSGQQPFFTQAAVQLHVATAAQDVILIMLSCMPCCAASLTTAQVRSSGCSHSREYSFRQIPSTQCLHQDALCPRILLTAGVVQR